MEGILDSCYNLGIMYYNGEGTEKDYTKALNLYRKHVMQVLWKDATTLV